LALSSSRNWVVLIDRVALGALGAGLALYVIPWWNEGRLQLAFWVTFVATLFHVYTSHRRASFEGA
jgi:hypothetical protein